VTTGGHRHNHHAGIVDRNTAVQASTTPVRSEQLSTLEATLERLRLDGAIFFRAEMTEKWAYQSPTAAEMAGFLRPGAERLIMFHIVESGRLWVKGRRR
jgi:hypothetical protein